MRKKRQQRQAAAREAENRRRRRSERKADRRKLYQAEKAKVDSLLATANEWRKSQDLREYIEARLQRHLAEHGAVEPGGEFANWPAWANQQADRIDPLRPQSPVDPGRRGTWQGRGPHWNRW